MGGRRGGEWYGVNGAMGHQRRALIQTDDLPPARSTVDCTCQQHELEDDPTRVGQEGERLRRHKGDAHPCSFLTVFGDRDALAAINILLCGLHTLWRARRPDAFRRNP